MRYCGKFKGDQEKRLGRGRPSRKNAYVQTIQRGQQSRSRSRQRYREKKQRNCFSLQDILDMDEHHAYEDEEKSSDQSSPLSLSSDQNQDIASQLRVAFIQFFGQTKHAKGFVFTPKERARLRNQQLKKLRRNKSHQVIEWKAESEWQEHIEKGKIDKVFEPHASCFSETQIEFLKSVFLCTSYIFADEVTEQLYRLLLKIACLVVSYSGAKLQAETKLLMDEVSSANGAYTYFSFSFSSYFKLSMQKGEKRLYEELGLRILQIFRDQL